MKYKPIAYNQLPEWQKKMLLDYIAAKKRIFLLDYDGTLAPFVDKPKLAKPSTRVRKVLSQLAVRKQIGIVIVSGRDRSDLNKWFRDIPVTLIVGHGSFIRHANQQKWQEIGNHDISWQPVIINILGKYASKVPGSFVEQKSTSLVWHYRAAKLGQVQESLPQLKQSLRPIADEFGLKIEDGSMILEVIPKGINKGTAAIECTKNTDFIVAIGDDTTDEAMFKALQPSAWTIKVGNNNTSARYSVPNVAAVHDLLDKFNQIS